MTAPDTTPPCDWPVIYGGTCMDSATPEQKALYEQLATEFLWNWTNRIYGPCPVTIRPCRADCSSLESTFWGGGPYTGGSAANGAGAPWAPALIGGSWFNLSCGRCSGDGCSCSAFGTPALRLPGPVASIEEVRIDGTALDPINYRVDNHSLLVRLDGAGWPPCQDMSGDSTADEGTWQVTYLQGVEVPMGGQVAAGLLACELLKAATGDRSCQLPQRVQTISRQGVTVTMLDSFDDLEKGRTGIWSVDSWVASVTKPLKGGSVYSVDIPRPRHRVTTWP
jgi:hypothetical protein